MEKCLIEKSRKYFRDLIYIFKDKYYFVNLTAIFLSTALSSLVALASTVANSLPYPSAAITCVPTPCFDNQSLM